MEIFTKLSSDQLCCMVSQAWATARGQEARLEVNKMMMMNSGLCSNAFANASANAAFALAFDSPVMDAFALAFDSSAFAFDSNAFY